MEKGELKDNMYPGISFVIDLLIDIQPKDLLKGGGSRAPRASETEFLDDQSQDHRALNALLLSNAGWILDQTTDVRAGAGSLKKRRKGNDRPLCPFSLFPPLSSHFSPTHTPPPYLQGVRIFTKRPKAQAEKLFNVSDVMRLLDSYPEARLQYLEYLVFSCSTEVESYHTDLAMSLVSAVKRKRLDADNQRRATGTADEAALLALKERLRRVLRTSTRYNTDLLLRELESTDYHAERAMVYGKAGMHEDALHLIVYEIGDHTMARDYCNDNTEGQGRQARQKLFFFLLRVYLQPKPGKDPFTSEAIELLNDSLSDLNVVEVLDLLPGHWHLRIIERFLRQAVRRDVHQGRMSAVRWGLGENERGGATRESQDARAHPIPISS